jgi:hypothetical protein
MALVTLVQGYITISSFMDYPHSRPSNLLIFAGLSILSGSLILLANKYKKACERVIQAYSNDKKTFNYLFEKANLGWGIFDISGNTLQYGKHLQKAIAEISDEEHSEISAWATIAEALDLSNLYDLSTLNEGTHEIPVKINRQGLLPEDITLKITKCSKAQKVIVVLHKEPNTPPLTLPQEKPVHVITVVQKQLVNVNTLIEESVEDLSYFIQANNLVMNIQTESDHIMKCHPEEVKNSITKLIRDVGNYVCASGGRRKIDILAYSEGNKAIVSFMLYNNPVSPESVHLNISTNEETWTLDNSLEKFENDFSDYQVKVTLNNNYDQEKNFLFANLDFQIPTDQAI